MELAHLAWTGVPLCRPRAARGAPARLRLLADAYGGVARARRSSGRCPSGSALAVDGIRTAVAAGDEQMRNLILLGEPERTEVALLALQERLPALRRALACATTARLRSGGAAP